MGKRRQITLKDSYLAIEHKFGRIPHITKKQIREIWGDSWNWDLTDPDNRVKRGTFGLDWSILPLHSGVIVDHNEPSTTVVPEANRLTGGVSVEIPETVSFIPETDNTYVKFGHHRTVDAILKSEIFYPTFITGLSGNGKTFMVEQACAQLGRECIRVNITIETDEDDLLGGFRLVNGETVFHKGPVVDAMERGAVLLLDEIDLASNKILCLQPVLEGKGVYLKKINQWVKPTSGFTIIATANTNGKGAETGSFVGTQILNEAFLERFAITIEQNYPTAAVEKRLLLGHMAEYDNVDDDFAEQLTKWADIIRKTYQDGGIDEIISTRRLVHIVKAHSIFNDKMSAIKLCISRFDEETKTSFLDVYTKVDENVNMDVDTDTVDEPVPF